MLSASGLTWVVAIEPVLHPVGVPRRVPVERQMRRVLPVLSQVHLSCGGKKLMFDSPTNLQNQLQSNGRAPDASGTPGSLPSAPAFEGSGMGVEG